MNDLHTSPRRMRDFSTATTSKREKRLGMADPVVWEWVTRTLSQQHHLSALMTPERSPGPRSDAFNAPSTPSSRRKMLDRFAKDLEIYANVTGAFGKLPQVSSTATESHNTLHTVQELLPYHDQFRAAGLAVTSAEQSAVPKDQGPPKPPLPPPSTGFQLDGGRPVEKQGLANQKDSSSSPEIRFAEQEGLSRLLVDELPTPKTKGMSPTKRLPRIYKEQRSNPRTLPQVKEDDYLPPKLACPTAPSRPPPATPKASTAQTGSRSLKKPPPQEPNVTGFSPVSYARSPPTVPPKAPARPRAPGEELEPGYKQYSPVIARKNLPRQTRHSGSPSYERVKLASHARNPSRPTGLRVRGESASTVKATPTKATRISDMVQERSAISRDTKHSQDVTSNGKPDFKSPKRTPTKLSKMKEEVKALPELPKEKEEERASPPPELPPTWQDAEGGSSSFERALDAVMDKLDDMEPTKDLHGSDKSNATNGAVSSASRMRKATPTPGIKPSTGSTAVTSGYGNLSLIPADESVDYYDRDITDRDVLKGLKMAISAACDEEVDAWVRSKTGLRLRRFLADLKAFEDLEQERVPIKEEKKKRVEPEEDEQRARNRRAEKRRLQAEIERRRENKSKENTKQI